MCLPLRGHTCTCLWEQISTSHLIKHELDEYNVSKSSRVWVSLRASYCLRRQEIIWLCGNNWQLVEIPYFWHVSLAPPTIEWVSAVSQPHFWRTHIRVLRWHHGYSYVPVLCGYRWCIPRHQIFTGDEIMLRWRSLSPYKLSPALLPTICY